MRTPEWNPKQPGMPVDHNGDFMHYPGYEQDRWHVILQPFYAVMEIEKMTSGRSSKYLNLRNRETGQRAPMFVSDLVKGITEQSLAVVEGVLCGYWTGSKRGSNYGLKTVGGKKTS